ncbi:nuclear transport factor 2 family protein [Secundilactobacillus folii]|uniref:Nuclear transport factor 2 family protein n=1 Tax=Secundilactobacillus folii TaxID=2678357 RepID=A0A7X2XW42_9LACO|nr:nuclear transport factor 2 family protein [Secundilactobacillus folii]MTV82763.1 nuclear transport factor 2 family protein [Secundilactobacillus folii]
MNHLTVQDLIDREEIHDVLTRYCRGLDRIDEDLIRSAFFSDALIGFPGDVYQGPVDGFVKFLSKEMRDFERTQHFLGNCYIELDGDVAYVETYLMANHRATMQHKWHGKHVTLWGRYVDRFEKREGEWRIAQRRLLLDFQRDDNAGGWREIPKEQLGLRDQEKDPAITHEQLTAEKLKMGDNQ